MMNIYTKREILIKVKIITCLASQDGHVGVVRMLLQAGANSNNCDTGCTPLHIAVQQVHTNTHSQNKCGLIGGRFCSFLSSTATMMCRCYYHCYYHLCVVRLKQQ